MPRYQKAHVTEIPATGPAEPGWYEWLPVRHHFGGAAFGTNAFLAHEVGDQVVEEHDEVGERAGVHEEMYVVLQGRARFTVDGEQFDAPPGTLVYVAEPEVVRSAVALERETVVLAVGGARGKAFEVSVWEDDCLEREQGPR